MTDQEKGCGIHSTVGDCNHEGTEPIPKILLQDDCHDRIAERTTARGEEHADLRGEEVWDKASAILYGKDPECSLTMIFPDGYAELALTLRRALQQSAEGKGKERHSAVAPNAFRDQPIMVIQRLVGPAYAGGQAIKKIQEASRREKYDAIAELLGAIVYCAAEILYLEEN